MLILALLILILPADRAFTHVKYLKAADYQCHIRTKLMNPY